MKITKLVSAMSAKITDDQALKSLEKINDSLEAALKTMLKMKAVSFPSMGDPSMTSSIKEFVKEISTCKQSASGLRDMLKRRIQGQ